MKPPRIEWPDNKRFAFTIFDDPDFQTRQRAGAVYDLLAGCGMRTTKGVWPCAGSDDPEGCRGTCTDPDYLDWALGLSRLGFEIGWHGATFRTSTREQTARAFEEFRRRFGCWPKTATNHYDCDESLYWGASRLSGVRRPLYTLATRGHNNHSYGHVRGHPYYWGDLCRHRVHYFRNFVFGDINTLKACPPMPYHDPERPDVRYWFASSEGACLESFNRTIREEAQDRLEEEGGACIMYAHFAYDFVKDGAVDCRFRQLIERLSRKNGWFVPVAMLLDYMIEKRGAAQLTAHDRAALEWRWLLHKLRFGGA